MTGNDGCKTREDVEKLKSDWLYDPIWDIYDTEGYEEFRDELMEFQKKHAAAWEQQHKKERERLGSLLCPMATRTERKCCTDECAWWCNWENACAIKAIAINVDILADNLSE